MSEQNFLERLLEGVAVEWKELGEISEFYGGLTGKSKTDFENGNAAYIPYKYIFNNIEVKSNPFEFVKVGETERQNQVEYGDVLFTGSSETIQDVGMSSAVTSIIVDRLFLNSFSFGIRFNDEVKLLPEFSKYLFRSKKIRAEISKTASGVTRYNISKSKFKKIRIPIPSIEIQNKIAHILDTFTERTTELTAELTAELAARKKQHAYYRDQMLTFEGSDVEWKSLAEVALIGTGSRNTNEANPNGKFPFYVRSQEPLQMDDYEFDETAIITAGDGVGVGKVFHFVEGKYSLHQRAYRVVVTDSKVNPRFLFHFFRNDFGRYLKSKSVHASVTSLRKPMFEKYPVPILQPNDQARISTILDKFDALTTSLTEGLPREIELRQKQYEYYRNLLLSFPKAEVKA